MDVWNLFLMCVHLEHDPCQEWLELRCKQQTDVHPGLNIDQHFEQCHEPVSLLSLKCKWKKQQLQQERATMQWREL